MTNCHQLKLDAADGKKYLSDVADPETLLRLIQSVPSPKADPIKLWLAKVGYERSSDFAAELRFGRAILRHRLTTYIFAILDVPYLALMLIIIKMLMLDNSNQILFKVLSMT